MPSILIHIANEDPVLCEVEHLPQNTDTMVWAKNPRRRDGKDLLYLLANVTHVMFPVSRITFIEVMPGEDDEELIGFIRE